MSYEARLALIFFIALAAMVALDQNDTEFGVVDAERDSSLVEEEAVALPESGPRLKELLSLEVVESGRRVSGPQLRMLLARQQGQTGATVYSFVDSDNAMASAMAVDKRHYMVHSYLEGYAPFPADNIWVPWYTLSKRKTYALDDIIYPGIDDVWQSSREAYAQTRGDCEDHAIALADWLIVMGEDARVVLGEYGGGGHAWVVLFKNGKEYLLEATRKSVRRNMSRYPLARFETRYRPQFMFNRDTFWSNSGTTRTTKYASAAWIEKSRYGAD